MRLRLTEVLHSFVWSAPAPYVSINKDEFQARDDNACNLHEPTSRFPFRDMEALRGRQAAVERSRNKGPSTVNGAAVMSAFSVNVDLS